MENLHHLEVTVFAVLNFMPCFLLALYPFRKSLRCPPVATVLVIAFNALVHVLVSIIKYYVTYDGILSLICTAIHGLSMFLLIKSHFGKSLFTLLMLTNISNFMIVASKCMEGLIFPELAMDHHRWSNILTLVITECIVLIPLFIYYKKVYMNAIQSLDSLTAWNYLWLIPLTFYAVWFRNFYFSEEGAMELALRPRHLLFSFVINAGAMLVYTMIIQLIKEQTENMALREREHQLHMQHTQYGFLQERMEEARRFKHDLRHHLNVIGAYLQDQKYSEAEEYISHYRQSLPIDTTLSYCDNLAINALLQHFAGFSKINGVGFSAVVQLPLSAGIPDEALTVVIGNLLENALEACTAEGAGSVVSIRGKHDGTAVFLRVVNTCSKPPKQDDRGNWLSTKRPGPGIGLNSVKNIAEQYRGIMEAGWEDGKFTVSVLLNVAE